MKKNEDISNEEQYKTAQNIIKDESVKKSLLQSRMETQNNESIRVDKSPSMLSFIYDDMTQRMKNIEEFGSPLTQLSRILLSILTQMRLNLNEPDHPINVIVTKFQEILLKYVE